MKHPDALAWIVRRAMTEYNQRYETAEQMLHDLKVVAEAKDPFALRPLDLPSVRRGVKFEEPVEEAQPSFVTARAGSPNPAAHAAAAAAVAGGAGVAGRRVAAGFGPQVPPRGDAPKPARNKPAISVTSWWTGRYTARPLQDPREAGRDAARQAARSAGDHMRAAIHAARDQVRQSMQQVREQMHQHARAHAPAGERPVVAPVDRRPAYEQLKSARHRVESHRKRAQERFQHGRRRVSAGGIAFRVVLALGALAAAGLVLPRVLDKLDHKLSRFGAVEAPTAGRTATVAPQPQRGPLGPRVMVNGLDVQDVVAPPLQWNDEVPADAAARVEYLRRQLEVVSKAYEAARREVIATVGAATTPAAPKAVAPSVPAMPAEPLGRILLVNNHPAAANAQIRDMIDAEMDRVENVGFEVFRNEELEAQVHRIMATHAGEPLHEIIPNLSQFLDDNEDPEIRGLVWVSGLTSGPGEVECWYIVEGEAQPGSLTGGLKHLRSLKPTKGVIANWTTLTPSKH